MSRSTRHQMQRRHRGSMMAAMLLCLLAIMMFSAALTRSIVLHHRQLQQTNPQQQSLWLADCGLQRALYKLSQDAAYRGETWEVPAGTLGGPDAGLVKIRIEPAGGRDDQLTVFVQSEYPRDSVYRVIHLRERTLDSNPGELP